LSTAKFCALWQGISRSFEIEEIETGPRGFFNGRGATAFIMPVDGSCSRHRSNPDFLLGAARPLPPSADIGPGGQSVGQAAQFCLGRRAASPVTATTDFLAPDILNKCGRAVPAPSDALQRTLTTDCGGSPSLDGYRQRSRITSSPRHGVSHQRWGCPLLGPKQDVRWSPRNFAF
jgi:hypothetical protein